ncbi:hypothetical protein CMQ_303 [Grosmannia clavigera kw1407]|uniref:Uncharacterized protein n=1 Tax=Grosmannia clavigera (strain kw1407 / UAMH 11150) TaxID=655863 RepID=F0XRD4_GROCL|nr:uncharacterized protein CMQ_303 [Grosmannia clavigera kw1407]EFW99985.1 hypothetical protein CMQ_303 [Grosmannia clavigera kw1407]
MPPPVRNPTYMLAPNWTFLPGGPIGLGNIIADPFYPHIVLTRPAIDPESSPSVQRALERDCQLQSGSKLGVSVGLWARFLDSVGLNLRTKHENQRSTTYKMSSLETLYYTDMPTLAEVQERIEDPVVHELMRLNNPFSKPVYMVTGLKIAKGFSLSDSGSSTNGGSVGSDIPIAGGPATVGAEAAVEVEKEHSYKSEAGSDIVFAYQLMTIAPKGWKKKTFRLAEHHSSAVFLGDDDDEEEPAIEVELDYPKVADLKEFGTDFSHMTVMDGVGECICIAYEGEE